MCRIYPYTRTDTEAALQAYESYVVYSFFKLMRDFLGDKPRALAKLKAIQVIHALTKRKTGCISLVPLPFSRNA